jgi:hypothetical protein
MFRFWIRSHPCLRAIVLMGGLCTLAPRAAIWAQDSAENATTVQPSNGGTFDPAQDIRRSSGLYGEVTNSGLRRFLVLLTAFLIGFGGAAAFHYGVFIGFIARDSRASLLEFLHIESVVAARLSRRDMSLLWLRRVLFWMFGGGVAVVFQMADADSLVPIQAFVLGASWPSVVTQLMSGRSLPPPPQPANLSPPPQPPAPGASDAGAGTGQSVELIN